MVGVLTFFAGPIGRWLVMGLMVAVFGAWCWFKGNAHGTAKLTEYQGRQAIEAVRIVTKRGEVTNQVITKYVKVAGETQIVTVTLMKEVDRYAETNAGSCLDVGWGRLHDAAAANRVPNPGPPAPGPVRAPPAAPAVERPRITDSGGGAFHGHLELRAASSLRRPPG